MIARLEEIAREDLLDADLCIVGAGAAGLMLAGRFLNTRWNVIVLESGLLGPDPTGDDLNTLLSVGLRHDGWREGRIRALGGTTRAWGGQLIPLRASEIEERSWVPRSGWPIELAELQPFYRRVEELLQIEGPPYDRSAWQRLGMSAPALDADRFCVRFSQWAALRQRNFAVLWRRALERSGNVSVVLDATAVAVHCAIGGDRCESLRVRSRQGLERRIGARAFVLACGGIEAARLLLASPSPKGNGIANRSGWLGRCFQDHVSFIAGEVQPTRRRRIQDLFDPRYLGNTMFSVKIEPTDAAMREERWLNVMGHIAFEIPDALGWLELRRMLRSLQAGRLEWPSFDASLAMARGSGELLRLVATRYLARRRRSPAKGAVRLLVDSEQAPNPESRILLDDDRDAFGMPRARLDWRLGELEHRTLTGFSRAVSAELERLGLGKIALASEPAFDRRDVLGAARDIFHHMGTTRMSADPQDGVVRPDLQCHDIANLYVAGPSVFPTSGIANPTFTALALSIRLADHLARALELSAREATVFPERTAHEAQR